MIAVVGVTALCGGILVGAAVVSMAVEYVRWRESDRARERRRVRAIRRSRADITRLTDRQRLARAVVFPRRKS